MAPKVEVWAAFRHFDHADLESTFKKAPGAFFRHPNAEEPASPKSVGRKTRSMSVPPRSSEPAWAFHHKDSPPGEWFSGLRPAPRDVGREKANDQLVGTGTCLRRRLLRCASPESRVRIANDFNARGVFDVDRNLRRGQGTKPHVLMSSPLEDGNVLQERQYAMLSQLANSMGLRSECSDVPEFVEDLGDLGIECRRLTTSSLAHTASMMKLSAVGGASAIETRKFAPVRRTKTSARERRPKPTSSHFKDVLDEASVHSLDEVSININSQRLKVLYAAADKRRKAESTKIRFDKSRYADGLIHGHNASAVRLAALCEESNSTRGSSDCGSASVDTTIPDETEIERSDAVELQQPAIERCDAREFQQPVIERCDAGEF